MITLHKTKNCIRINILFHKQKRKKKDLAMYKQNQETRQNEVLLTFSHMLSVTE